MRSDHRLRFRLSYKILAVFFILSVFSAVLTTGLLRYFAAAHFKQYVREMDMNAVGKLIPALIGYYEEHGAWTGFRENRGAWEKLLGDNLGTDFPFDPHRKPMGDPPGFPEDQPGRPPGPDNGPPPPPDNHFLKRRIGLFDADKHQVTGPQGKADDFDLREITVHGKTVGWVGLMELPRPPRPPESDFIQRQFRVFYMVGGALLLVSALVAVLLSRSLLSPVRRLAEGTRALSERRFDTRVRVESSDELGQLAHHFNEMAERLEKYETRQKRWLTDISHELRTPLSILIGEIEALQDGVRRPDAKSLASLQAEASHLNKIVNDLNDLSLAEAEAMPLHRRRIEPFFILSEMAESFREQSLESSLEMILDVIGIQNVSVAADPARLRQVFVNLYQNAVQHAAKPGTLLIRGRTVDSRLRITFEDSGPGVPEEALPYLFDRLYRVETSRSRTTGGSGLGLSICKGLIESHGGEIRAARGDLGGLRIEIDLDILEK